MSYVEYFYRYYSPLALARYGSDECVRGMLEFYASVVTLDEFWRLWGGRPKRPATTLATLRRQGRIRPFHQWGVAWVELGDGWQRRKAPRLGREFGAHP